MNEEMQRAFKGIWIPKEIWLSKDLKLIEKCFLVEIDSLDNDDDGCYASNDYFAEFFNLSKNRCSEIINKLKKKGYIRTAYIKSNGKRNIEKRVIHILEKSNRGIRKIQQGYSENRQGYSENCEDNNIDNNISNNISNSNVNLPLKKILDLWNALPDPIKNIQAITEKRRKKIKARINGLNITENEIFKAIENIRNSEFVQGKNNKGWIIDFDWLFKDDNNFAKVLENKYQNRTASTNSNAQYNSNVQAGLDLVKKYEDEEKQGNEGASPW